MTKHFDWFTASITVVMIFVLAAVTSIVYCFFGGLYAEDLATVLLVELSIAYVVTFVIWAVEVEGGQRNDRRKDSNSN